MNVALLAEGVDRNPLAVLHPGRFWVALLAEGVDRNVSRKCSTRSIWVALLAEGVDRNIRSGDFVVWGNESPSSRRAWIEITTHLVS